MRPSGVLIVTTLLVYCCAYSHQETLERDYMDNVNTAGGQNLLSGARPLRQAREVRLGYPQGGLYELARSKRDTHNIDKNEMSPFETLRRIRREHEKRVIIKQKDYPVTPWRQNFDEIDLYTQPYWPTPK